MKASELRIGNYHLYYIEDKFDEHKEWDEVCTIDAKDLVWLSSEKGKNDLNYKPIPLTEKWFKKLGFRKLEKRGMYGYMYAMSHFDYDYIIERDFEEYISHFVGIEYTDSNDKRDKGKVYHFSYDLKYVHQLQNLYFALTKEELQILISIK
jgi:hypothetical protein